MTFYLLLDLGNALPQHRDLAGERLPAQEEYFSLIFENACDQLVLAGLLQQLT